ncbi:MAG: GDP-mannose 4,6-dehydratase [Sphingomonas sp.]|uniref:NAD-dependent epimerase/dehydratase family protein n=1 Tax=Sphingomonas sp. TaxID=28214 RepID=UPI0017E12DC9|nr:NAD-dependent epimerase/dehydratase family protein [Sphingomonas sp.]MBA3666283.1 GDP-mannose 4,6-dehydratase [Sphingomonas sp.]
MTVLVTGAAGFIGSATVRALLVRGERVVGIDDLNEYYDPALKRARLAEIDEHHGKAFTFHQVDFADEGALAEFAAPFRFDRIVHFGAQAGVRYSLTNPAAYARSNLMGQINILQLARAQETAHLVYASSSSVYGANHSLPFRVEDRADQPVSLYAATKKSGELMAESYAHLYRLPMTGLRFFTVYGPWGRPDMAMWLFTAALFAGLPLTLFNNGEMRRDFTYIDDIVRGVLACVDTAPIDNGEEKAGGSNSPHAIYNLGNHRSEELMRMIGLLEQATGKTAILDRQPMQPGDVKDTFADLTAIERDLGFAPTTSIDEGIPRFVDWFKRYHRID